MFFAIISLALSLYLPYSATNDFVLDVVSDKDLQHLMNKSPYLVLLAASAHSEHLEDQEYAFSSLPTIFPPTAVFVTITQQSAPKAFAEYGDEFSNIIFFQGGRKVLSFAFPELETDLVGAISFFLQQEYSQLTNKSELYSHLGEAAYSIIATDLLVPSAQKYLLTFSQDYGPINIICAKESLLVELGFTGKKLCLYRKADKVISEVNDTDESVLQAFKPSFFSHVTSEMLTKTTEPIALFITNERPTAEQKDALSRLGTQFPKYVFGIVASSEADPIKALVGKLSTPSFVVCSFGDALYYAPTLDISYEAILKYLNSIENGSLKPQFLSEPIPENPTEGALTKLVGLTYETFINDPKSDAVVFYLADDFNFGTVLAKQLAEYISNISVSGIKVGYINVRNNSASIGFPVMFSDNHVQIFPASNKSANKSFVGSLTLYSLVKFAKKYGISNITESEALFDPEIEMSYLIHFTMELSNYYEEVQKMMLDYITEMGYKFGFGYTTDEIIDHIYEMRGMKRNTVSHEETAGHHHRGEVHHRRH